MGHVESNGQPPELRVRALGDVHLTPARSEEFRSRIPSLAAGADLVVLAGDLTDVGTTAEAHTVAEALADVDVPVVVVLGNHDHQAGRPHVVTSTLTASGVHVLDGDSIVVQIGAIAVGIAGVKGFGGGFAGAETEPFGEPEMKAFARQSPEAGRALQTALQDLDVDVRVALLHYAPTRDTLEGEPRELYPMLGSRHLGDAVDRGGAHVAFHGHAHLGTELGRTPGGVPVRNVAAAVVGDTGALYRVTPHEVTRIQESSPIHAS